MKRDMKIYPVIFRAEVSKELGLGHMIRCLNFVESIPVPLDPHFVVHKSPELKSVTEPLVKRGWTIHPLKSGVDDRTDAEQTARIAHHVQAKFLVTDLCHRSTIENPDRLIYYHRNLRSNDAPFVLSIEDCRMAAFSSNAAIIWNTHRNIDELHKSGLDGCRVMAGLQYFICSHHLANLRDKDRKVKVNGKRVLVSIGGSDPKGLTLKIARALSQIKSGVVEAKILLGISSSQKLRQDISLLCTSFPNLKFIGFSDTIGELLLWADIAITGEGLTKYETAIMGTPSLMISQFDHNGVPIREFLEIGCTRYLGPGDNLSETRISNEVNLILADHNVRVALSQAGMNALDGRGMERIYRNVLKDILEDNL